MSGLAVVEEILGDVCKGRLEVVVSWAWHLVRIVLQLIVFPEDNLSPVPFDLVGFVFVSARARSQYH